MSKNLKQQAEELRQTIANDQAYLNVKLGQCEEMEAVAHLAEKMSNFSEISNRSNETFSAQVAADALQATIYRAAPCYGLVFSACGTACEYEESAGFAHESGGISVFVPAYADKSEVVKALGAIIEAVRTAEEQEDRYRRRERVSFSDELDAAVNGARIASNALSGAAKLTGLALARRAADRSQATTEQIPF